jgi:hypothetical protein
MKGWEWWVWLSDFSSKSHWSWIPYRMTRAWHRMLTVGSGDLISAAFGGACLRNQRCWPFYMSVSKGQRVGTCPTRKVRGGLQCDGGTRQQWPILHTARQSHTRMRMHRLCTHLPPTCTKPLFSRLYKPWPGMQTRPSPFSKHHKRTNLSAYNRTTGSEAKDRSKATQLLP